MYYSNKLFFFQPHPAINRRSLQGRGDKKPKIISLPTNQNIKLHESENAWKPAHKSEKTAAEEDAEEQVSTLL